MAQIEDRVATLASALDESGGTPGTRKKVFAAVALVDAPFLDAESMSDASDPLAYKLKRLNNVPVGVRQALNDLGDDLSNPAGNAKRLRERYAATET